MCTHLSGRRSFAGCFCALSRHVLVPVLVHVPITATAALIGRAEKPQGCCQNWSTLAQGALEDLDQALRGQRLMDRAYTLEKRGDVKRMLADCEVSRFAC